MNRKLLYISTGFLFANMSWGMAWPYLPNYMRLLGGSVLFIAFLSVFFNITSAFGQAFWGRKSDAVGRRKPFILLGLFSSALFFSLMGLVQNAIALLSFRTLQGFFVSSQTPAISALVSELSTNIGRGFGIFNLFSNIGFMLGNFLGGVVVHYFPINYVFIFSVIPVAISFVMFSLFKEESRNPMDFRLLFRYDRPGRTVVSWKNAREFMRKNRNILIFSLATFVLMISSGMVYSYLSLLLDARFGEGYVGFYYGIDGLFSSFFIYPFGYLSDKIGSKTVIVIGSILYVVTFGMYFMATTIPFLIITALISGTKWAAYFNSINTYVSRMSTREERATALGLMNSGIAMGWVLGPLIGAYTIVLFGLAEMMLIATIPVILSLIILVPFTKNDREKKYNA